MKWRKITLVTQALGDGSKTVPHSEADLLFSPRHGLLVNDKVLPHHGFTIGAEGDEDFLTLTVLNVERDAFNEFMADETPDDVLEGTGVPTFTRERSSDEMDNNGPDELTWQYGANIVLPIHDLELRVEVPVRTEE
jgi:hypothetical protein